MISADNPTVLVVSQLPPPVHGSTIITGVFLSALTRLGINPVLVDKRFSRELTDIGKLSARKIGRLVSFYWRLARAGMTGGRHICVYFLTVWPSSFFVDYLAIAILRLCGIGVVPYLHGIGYTSLARRGYLWRRMVVDVFRSAAAVVVSGAASREDVAEWLNAGREFVIPNTLPDAEPCEPAQTGAEGPRCLYLSTIAAPKGPQDLIQAAMLVLSQNIHATFVLAGQVHEQSFRHELEQQIDACQLRGKALVIGPVSDDEKSRLLASADVFAFPSHHECFPLVVLEAMRAGLPIVATRVGSTPEQIEDGVSGYLVPPREPNALAERLARLLVDSESRRRLGDSARARYDELFSPYAYAERWREVMFRVKVLTLTPCRPDGVSERDTTTSTAESDVPRARA
ncbi:MAG: glycosyltransferase [Steroidobacteraceae bacterium]|nr:glycosyltransferase [Steroidobacteraceae bacterium]